jgi:uncharacterized membrane protein
MREYEFMRMFFNIFSFIVLLIVYLSGLFIQEMSNKSIFFGVRVPVGYNKEERLLKLKRQFKRNFTLSFLGFVVPFMLGMQVFYYEVYIFLSVAAALIGVAILNINYYIIHKRVKAIKKEEGWKFENNRIVVVDTTYRKKDTDNKRVVVSPWWFLIPAAIIIVNLIIVLVNYQALPDKIPMHFDFSGQADRWSDKSYFSVLFEVIMQIGLTLLMYVVYKYIEKAKQSLNGGEVNNIKKVSRRKRYVMSLFIVIVTVFINIQFFLIGLMTLGKLKSNSIVFSTTIAVMLILPLVLVIAQVVVGRKDSQEAEVETTEEGKLVINRDDDDYYWMGTWYYNKNDPALFVEKRVGFGMDFNYARPAAKIFMIFVALLIIGVFVLVSTIPGMTRGRDVQVTENSIKISGVWGLTIEEQEIDHLEISTSMPKVLMKTNGADIENKLFGKHKLEGYDNAVLFIEDKTKPFIAIYTKNQGLILINYKDESRTDTLLEEINKNIQVKMN